MFLLHSSVVNYLNKPVVWTSEITKISIKGDILMSVRAPVGPVNINPFDKICIGRGDGCETQREAVLGLSNYRLCLAGI